jgi:hypothetical protein
VKEEQVSATAESIKNEDKTRMKIEVKKITIGFFINLKLF